MKTEERVQLRHPHGKKPVSMEREKYDLLRSALLKCLRSQGTATFSELTKAIEGDLKARAIKFHGSLPWHLEWVKLDLEARKIIKRAHGITPQKFTVLK